MQVLYESDIFRLFLLLIIYGCLSLKKNFKIFYLLSILTAIKDFDVPNMHLSIIFTLFPTNIFQAIFALEAAARTCSVKKVLLEISQNLQETPLPESIF